MSQATSEPIDAVPTAATLTTTETELDVLKPGDSPTFYAMLLFHRGFCEYMFNDHFNFLKKNDQYFGPGTFGQLSCFMAERTYVMKMHLECLKNGGWKDLKEFADYAESLMGVPERSDDCANCAFFIVC